MCIIISKPAGVEFPNILTLRNCWNRNPHGAGYAVAYKGRVSIRKGFMTWDEFVESIDFDGLAGYSCVFHFRFATRGSQSAGNCHPFPVNGNLRRESARTEVAIAHNGTIKNVEITKDDYSDTMSYIEQTIRPFWSRCKKKESKYMYSIKQNREILLKETGGKWAFLFADGKIVNVGKGITENGIWYSNAGFRDVVRRMVWRDTLPVMAARDELEDFWDMRLAVGSGYHVW
jgi:glutamine phosphoribosylpyrophosphate amidotransferase